MKERSEKRPHEINLIVLDKDIVKSLHFIASLNDDISQKCVISTCEDKTTSVVGGYFGSNTSYRDKLAIVTTVQIPGHTYKFTIPKKIDLESKDFYNLLFSYELEGPDAIIYLDLEPEQKACIEACREQSHLIAVDFNAMECSPGECLESIPYFLNKTKELRQESKAKSALVLLGQQDTASSFSSLPVEVVQKISVYQYGIKSIFNTKPPQQDILEKSDTPTPKRTCQLF